MDKRVFERLWVNTADKVVSFQEMAGWTEYTFSSVEKAVYRLSAWIAEGYRFQ